MKIICFFPVWGLYLLGALFYSISKHFKDEKYVERFYKLYSYLMCRSDDLQTYVGGRGKHWPWYTIKLK